MSDDDDRRIELEDRRRALEEAFFRKESERLREQLHERLYLQHEQEAAQERLAGASGIADRPLLARLASLGIRAETLAALTLIPLVEVAWADGEMDRRERDAVLRGAESCGIERGTPSHGLLGIWTEDRPAPELVESWKRYIHALCAELSADQRRHLEERILGRARAVAQAAGGFLGLAKVSKEEEAVLDELEAAFGH
jgi:hypothetical protein